MSANCIRCRNAIMGQGHRVSILLHRNNESEYAAASIRGKVCGNCFLWLDAVSIEQGSKF